MPKVLLFFLWKYGFPRFHNIFKHCHSFPTIFQNMHHFSKTKSIRVGIPLHMTCRAAPHLVYGPHSWQKRKMKQCQFFLGKTTVGEDGGGDGGIVFQEHPSPILHAPRDNISRKDDPSLRFITNSVGPLEEISPGRVQETTHGNVTAALFATLLFSAHC